MALIFQPPIKPRRSRTTLFSLLLITLLFLLSIFTATARTYTVKSGDTLQRIAQRELGSAARWPDIARLNNLPPPHTIRLGQQLNLPDTQTGMIPLAPPTPTNAPAPTHPAVPPGNIVPPDPPPTTSTPMPTNEHAINISDYLSWSLPLILLLGTFLQALNLRISCWFSQIETTYFRCLKLAIYLEILGTLCFIGGMLLLVLGIALGVTAKFEPWSIAALIAILPLVLLAWFLLSLFAIKNTLDCKWRSVVTLLVMSWFVSWVAGIIIFISTVSYAPLAKLLSELPK
ncbi:MAG TPA: LysM domain-containing protein [Verrucomicrobiae bacterium]